MTARRQERWFDSPAVMRVQNNSRIWNLSNSFILLYISWKDSTFCLNYLCPGTIRWLCCTALYILKSAQGEYFIRRWHEARSTRSSITSDAQLVMNADFHNELFWTLKFVMMLSSFIVIQMLTVLQIHLRAAGALNSDQATQFAAYALLLTDTCWWMARSEFCENAFFFSVLFLMHCRRVRYLKATMIFSSSASSHLLFKYCIAQRMSQLPDEKERVSFVHYQKVLKYLFPTPLSSLHYPFLSLTSSYYQLQ